MIINKVINIQRRYIKEQKKTPLYFSGIKREKERERADLRNYSHKKNCRDDKKKQQRERTEYNFQFPQNYEAPSQLGNAMLHM